MNTMSEWKQRLLDERNELASRLSRLEIFLSTEPSKITPVEFSELQVQRDAMRAYFNALEVRVKRYCS